MWAVCGKAWSLGTILAGWRVGNHKRMSIREAQEESNERDFSLKATVNADDNSIPFPPLPFLRPQCWKCSLNPTDTPAFPALWVGSRASWSHWFQWGLLSSVGSRIWRPSFAGKSFPIIEWSHELSERKERTQEPTIFFLPATWQNEQTQFSLVLTVQTKI